MTAETPDLGWIADAVRPRIDALTAQHLIQSILALVPDEDLAEVEINDRGGVWVASVEHGVDYGVGGYGIGCTTAIDTEGERPIAADYRREAAERALEMEAIHRAELAHWANGGKPARQRMRTLDEFHDELEREARGHLKSVDPAEGPA